MWAGCRRWQPLTRAAVSAVGAILAIRVLGAGAASTSRGSRRCRRVYRVRRSERGGALRRRRQRPQRWRRHVTRAAAEDVVTEIVQCQLGAWAIVGARDGARGIGAR